MSVLDLQGPTVKLPAKSWPEQDEDTAWLLREWDEVLRHLRLDRARLIGRLDWVTKLWSLETFVRKERIAWDDRLASESGFGIP